MKSYGQYCPVARASELLAERWTPILIRNLLAGCTTFGQLQAGAPGIPKALLVNRLDSLVRAGIVSRRLQQSGRGWVYELTDKGRALRAVCDAMGEWGARWLEIEPRHQDPGYAVWATASLVDLDRVPAPGVTVQMVMRASPAPPRLWMLLFPPRVEVCSSAMGRDDDLVVETDAATLIALNLQRTSFAAATRSGRLHISGPRSLVRAFPGWLRPSPWAQVDPIPTADREMLPR